MQRITGSRTPHLGLARRSLNALIHGALPEGHGSTRARILPRGRRISNASCAVPSTAGAVVGLLGLPHHRREQVIRDVCPAELAHAIFEYVTRLYELT